MSNTKNSSSMMRNPLAIVVFPSVVLTSSASLYHSVARTSTALEKERYTLADALAWDEQNRIELIDGYPVMLAPPVRIHQKISRELLGSFTIT